MHDRIVLSRMRYAWQIRLYLVPAGNLLEERIVARRWWLGQERGG